MCTCSIKYYKHLAGIGIFENIHLIQACICHSHCKLFIQIILDNGHSSWSTVVGMEFLTMWGFFRKFKNWILTDGHFPFSYAPKAVYTPFKLLIKYFALPLFLNIRFMLFLLIKMKVLMHTLYNEHIELYTEIRPPFVVKSCKIFLARKRHSITIR